jgi:hypothetical protein
MDVYWNVFLGSDVREQHQQWMVRGCPLVGVLRTHEPQGYVVERDFPKHGGSGSDDLLSLRPECPFDAIGNRVWRGGLDHHIQTTTATA